MLWLVVCSCRLIAALPPVKIMPMGDSLTVFDCRLNAYTNADDRPIFSPLDEVPPFSIYPKGAYWINAQGGYRGYLAAMLGDPKRLPDDAAALPVWSYVGSQFSCGAHEGYSGETIEWLAQHSAAKAVGAYEPDVILFMGGTNDFFWPAPRGSRSPAEVADRLRILLNTTFAAAPNTTFLLSTTTGINATRCATYHTARWHPGDCPDDMQTNIDAYNQQHLPAVVADYRARGFDISLHDVNAEAGFVEADYWIWGIHFNATGFEKMASSWHKALVKAAPMRAAMGLPRS